MKVYIPVREGVYRHAMFGAFESKEEAVNVAKQSIEQEPDHYHECLVYEFEIGISVNDGVAVASLSWNKSSNCVECA